ncbi:hypothetical protein Tsubulata_008337 [Turnera subulata]|uniref:EngC GTPase domain-containing protein n=1 Tax=Turnera subulata TaxID=218843 RepID=A0A9Q0FTD6_9ROSI|nr:hypothetical protein Tsubulata_008337 [Turnera subulata]
MLLPMGSSLFASPFRHRIPTLHHHPHLLLRHITVFRNPLLPVNARKSQHRQQISKKQLRARHTAISKRDFSSSSSSLAPLLSPDHPPELTESQAIGRVAAAQANFMRVIVQVEEEKNKKKKEMELLCVVRAVLKKIKRRVMVGDKVVVGSIDWVDRRGMIENIFQRSTHIVDPPVANVDHLLLLFSIEQPKPEPFALTRFLVEAESSGIPFTLAFNKMELAPHQETLNSWRNRMREWGYDPVFCSVDSREGLDSLASLLKDQITVIVGPSGAGKSSLINALRSNPPPQLQSPDGEAGNWFDPIMGSKWFEDQAVGQVSAKSGRGKHTTRNVSLLPLSGGGFLADTPGFSQPSLIRVTKLSLAETFPEIRRMLSESEDGRCSFNDCLHVGEPGCVVRADWERYSYYFQLLDEIKIREEFQLRTFGTKREEDVRYKVGSKGIRQAEPRLELKKHRKESRKRINQTILAEMAELNDDDDDDDDDFEDDDDDDDDDDEDEDDDDDDDDGDDDDDFNDDDSDFRTPKDELQ